SKSTLPPTMRARWLGNRRRIERQATVLPEPLSPTIPSTSPAPRPRETLSTARNAPFDVTNSTERSTTLRRAIDLVPNPEVLGNSVSKQAEANCQNHNRETGKGGDPPSRGDEGLPLGDHQSPLRSRRLDPKAEIAQ